MGDHDVTAARNIELVGGPLDGEIRTVQATQHDLRLLVAPDLTLAPLTSQEGSGLDEAIPVRTIRYAPASVADDIVGRWSYVKGAEGVP